MFFLREYSTGICGLLQFILFYGQVFIGNFSYTIRWIIKSVTPTIFGNRSIDLSWLS